MSYLSYAWHRMRNPDWIDFVTMGLGIERRAAVFSASWKRHLEMSRLFVLEASAEGGDEVVVLGAGRLLDVPLEDLIDRFARVTLVDVNPQVRGAYRRAARRFGNRLQVEIADVTGAFQEWSKTLGSVSGAHNLEIAAAMRSLSCPAKRWGEGVVVSMNLLSQFGVMWRDRVFRILGCMAETAEISEAIGVSSARLEAAHWEGLAQADCCVIIADRYFFTVRQEESDWEVEEALYGGWQDEVGGKGAFHQDSWFWHLVPMHGERVGEGIIHEVWARAFRKAAI